MHVTETDAADTVCRTRTILWDPVRSTQAPGASSQLFCQVVQDGQELHDDDDEGLNDEDDADEGWVQSRQWTHLAFSHWVHKIMTEPYFKNIKLQPGAVLTVRSDFHEFFQT